VNKITRNGFFSPIQYENLQQKFEYSNKVDTGTKMYKNVQVTPTENVYKLNTLLFITVKAKVTGELEDCIITVMICTPRQILA